MSHFHQPKSWFPKTKVAQHGVQIHSTTRLQVRHVTWSRARPIGKWSPSLKLPWLGKTKAKVSRCPPFPRRKMAQARASRQLAPFPSSRGSRAEFVWPISTHTWYCAIVMLESICWARQGFFGHQCGSLLLNSDLVVGKLRSRTTFARKKARVGSGGDGGTDQL